MGSFRSIALQGFKNLSTSQDSSELVLIRKSVTPATNNTITLPGLDTFRVDNAQNIEMVHFTNLIGKTVLELPIKSITTATHNLPRGFYIVNFSGNKVCKTASFKILVR